MTFRITPEPSFIKITKRLPKDRKNGVNEALVRFIIEPTLPRLRFKPLKGHLGHFIIRAGNGDRVILRLDGPDDYAAVDVGPRDQVYRRWGRLK